MQLITQRVGSVETLIGRVEGRLSRGDDLLANLPALQSEMHALMGVMKETRQALATVVTHYECELRHGKEGRL